MRVLHIGSGNLYGGVETLLLTLARHQFMCPQMEQHFALAFEGRISGELQAIGAPTHLLGGVRVRSPWTIWQARQRVRALLQKEFFQYVVCHMPWPLAMFGPGVRPKTKLALWLHNPVSGKHWIERWASRVTPDLVICNSRFTACSVPLLYKGIPDVTAYCPVGLEHAQVSPQTRARIRSGLGIPHDGVAILQVSRMEEWKGHSLHLQALSMLKDVPNWTAWFVGGAQRRSEQEYYSKLQHSAVALGISRRVRFLGQRDDVPELLAAADIFCQPNKGPEPFGIVFVEALLAGLPVISTAIGGALEIVDKSCGILVPPEDSQALANTLREVILSSSVRIRLGKGGRERARRLCDPQLQLTKIWQTLGGLP